MNINKGHVKRQFDRSAATYDAVSQMQRDIVDVLLSHLESSSVVNDIGDVGCGTGYALSRLNDIYPTARLIGLDMAAGMLDTAVQQLAGGNAFMVQGDIESLPIKPSSLDICFSSSAIQWCDAERSIEQVSNVLKPKGRALVSSFLSGTLLDWRKLWGRNDQQFLSLSEFASAFDRAGLQLERVWSETQTQSFGSFESALNSVRSLGAGNASNQRLKGLTGRARFERIVKQVNDLIDRNGSIDLHYEVVYALACKPG